MDTAAAARLLARGRDDTAWHLLNLQREGAWMRTVDAARRRFPGRKWALTVGLAHLPSMRQRLLTPSGSP